MVISILYVCSLIKSMLQLFNFFKLYLIKIEIPEMEEISLFIVFIVIFHKNKLLSYRHHPMYKSFYLC